MRLILHFLADAGNLLDCACLAGIIALKHFRRPDVEVIGDEVTVVGILFMHGNGWWTWTPDIISLASPLWTVPLCYPSCTILLHFRILPWCVNASDYRSLSTRTMTQCRVDINTSICPKELCKKIGRSTALTQTKFWSWSMSLLRKQETNLLVEAKLQEDWTFVQSQSQKFSYRRKIRN